MESKSNSKPVRKSAIGTVAAIVLTAIIVGSVVGGAASYFSATRADAIVAEIKSQNDKTSSQIANALSENGRLKVDVMALQDENGKLKSQVSAVSSDLRAVADAAGIPINNPEELKKLMEERKVIEAAKQEGKVVVYSVADPVVRTALRGAFERRYPFVTVEYVGIPPSTTLGALFISEFDKGVKNADALMLGYGDLKPVMERRELLAKYVPKDIEWLSADLKDKEGRWVAYLPVILPIAYNTKLVPKDQAPKSLLDVVDPKWKGKIGITKSAAPDALILFEKLYGEGFIRQLLVEQNPRFYASVAETHDKLAAGEVAIIPNGVLSFIEPRKAAGQPVDWVRASDNTYPGNFAWAALAANAAHPNAARLWMDFLMSKEGNQVRADAGAPSNMPGIRIANPEAAPLGKKVTLAETRSEAERKAFLAKYPALAP